MDRNNFLDENLAILPTSPSKWRGQPYVPPALYSPGPIFPGPIFPGTYVPPS